MRRTLAKSVRGGGNAGHKNGTVDVQKTSGTLIEVGLCRGEFSAFIYKDLHHQVAEIMCPVFYTFLVRNPV